MRKVFLLAFICFVLCGCTKEQTKSLFAMDTVIDLKIYAENAEAIKNAEAEIKRLDVLLDRGSEAGEIYKINKDKTSSISPETENIIRTALNISKRTGGAFDITTASVSDLWGFYGGNFRVPSDNEINTAIKGVGYEKISLGKDKISIPENTAVDLGGIGKGYASDQISDILKNSGVSSAIISLGGNVHALGSKPDGSPWTVGISDAEANSGIIGTLSVSDKVVITSGSYQRYFEKNGVRYHHIIDPKIGKSADSGLKSVTVIADSGMTADGLSTALFVMGLDRAAELWRKSDDFEAVFIDDSGKIHITEGISDIFESSRDYEIIKR